MHEAERAGFYSVHFLVELSFKETRPNVLKQTNTDKIVFPGER